MLKAVILLVVLWPMLHVIGSPRSQGGAKVGWVILMALFSWLAYPFYLITTQKNISNSG